MAGVYATFDDTWVNVEKKSSEGGTLFAEVYKPMDELAKAQQHQARLQDELKNFRESLDIAVLDVEEAKLKDCRGLHDTVCRGLEDVGKKTVESKRKADNAHDKSRSHRERCQRANKRPCVGRGGSEQQLGMLGLSSEGHGRGHASAYVWRARS